ncbi:hypothetical protein ACLIA0_06160 [Bacillaceae bacterium W0354]
MNDLEHPVVAEIRRTGYPEQPNIYGTDLLGNEVYVGEEIYFLGNGEFIGAEELSEDSKKILEYLNVPKTIAND